MSISQFLYGSCRVRLVGRRQAAISLTCNQGRSSDQQGFQPLIGTCSRPGPSLPTLAGSSCSQRPRLREGGMEDCAFWEAPWPSRGSGCLCAHRATGPRRGPQGLCSKGAKLLACQTGATSLRATESVKSMLLEACHCK